MVQFLVALIGLRTLVYLRFESLGFDSDQAIVGLMAKHLSELRTFSVGALKDVAEVEPNNDFAQPQPWVVTPVRHVVDVRPVLSDQRQYGGELTRPVRAADREAEVTAGGGETILAELPR